MTLAAVPALARRTDPHWPPAVAPADIQAEQLRQLLAREPLLLRVGLGGTALLTLSQLLRVDWTWLLLFVALRLACLAHNRRVLHKVRSVGIEAAVAAGRLRQLEWGLLASGLSWGVAAWMLPLPLIDEVSGAVLLLILMSVLALMVHATACTRRALLGFAFGLWLPLLAHLLWRQDPQGQLLALSFLLYMGSLTLYGTHLQRHIERGIRDQLENRQLLDELKKAYLQQQQQSQALAQAQLHSSLARSHRQNYHDELTGLLNRRAFLERAQAEQAESSRPLATACLMLIDLDDFKRINERWGHDTGDLTLRACAQALHHALRGHDVLARWGGEEFVALLPRTHLADAAAVAERLRLALPQVRVGSEQFDPGLSASIGLAEWYPGDPLDLPLQGADEALYVAKDEGRNCVRMAQAAATLPSR